MSQAPLMEGADTIDSAKGQHWADGTVAISWSVLVPGEATARKRTTRGKKGTTVTELKRRAHRQAEKMIAEAQPDVAWTAQSAMADYVRSSVIPSIDEEPELRPRTRENYHRLARILLEETGRKTVGTFCKTRSLKAMLRHVATDHGTVTAKQLRKFLGKYVLTPLVEDEAIPGNPLAGVNVTLPKVRAAKKPEGGIALTPQERERCIRWLLDVDCEATASKAGRVTPKQAERRRRELVDITLLQATCGLRIGECLAIVKEDVYERDGILIVRIRDEISKTHVGREVPVVDTIDTGAAVAERLRRRVRLLEPGYPVFGAPLDPSRYWNQQNCMKGLRYQPKKLTARERESWQRALGPRADGSPRKLPERRLGLYQEMGRALGIGTLEDVATHVWRATLATERKAEGMPDAMVAALLGHSEEVDAQYYTDRFSAEQIMRAMGLGDGKVLEFRRSA